MILGILAGIATPRLLGISDRAEAAAIIANVNTIFSAAERYAAEHGTLPADAAHGVTPVELEPYMPTKIFGEKTGLGGNFDWNGPTSRAPVVGVGIRVSNWADPAVASLYQTIEEYADDSDPSTGWITRNTLAVHFKLDNK